MGLQRVKKKKKEEEGSWEWKGIQVKKRQSSCYSLEVEGCEGYFQRLNRPGTEAVQNKTEKGKEEQRKKREREQMKQENQHRPTSP